MIEGVISEEAHLHPVLSFIEGNFLQLKERKDDPTLRGETRLYEDVLDGRDGLQRSAVRDEDR